MPKKPPRPVTGKRVARGYDVMLWDFVMSLIPHGDKKTMRISHTDHGVNYSAILQPGQGAGGAASSSTPMRAKVKSKTAENKYTVDIYTNLDKDPIFIDETMKIREEDLEGTETIPVDIVLKVEQEEFGTIGNEEIFWTPNMNVGSI